MELVMCRSCGEFVTARRDDGQWVPMGDECPSCGGMEFEHAETDTVVRADDASPDGPDSRSGSND